MPPNAALALAIARERLALGDDDGAERAYLEVLSLETDNFEALNDLGVLAHRRGRRTAARLAHERSLRVRPHSPVARVNLANILMEDGAIEDARAHYLHALAAEPGFAAAHRGLARGYDLDADARAAAHWRLAGGEGLERRPKRGVGPAIPVLLIVSARLGNMPVAPWLDEKLFDVDILEAESFPLRTPLPPHALVLHAIGDADLCGEALRRAQKIAAASPAPLLNRPELVAATGRIDIAQKLGALADVETPQMRLARREDLGGEAFPLLLRAPGFHAGRHFLRVERRDELEAALAALPGDELIAIEPLDARGADGFHRKYRAMAIGGRWFPLHLAVSADWKVHYFSASMAAHPEHRDEERRFLDDIGALAPRALAALDAIAETIGLDYFGVDFAFAPDGKLRVFEANAAMAMLDPPPAAMWDYRRPALEAARAAAQALVVAAALGSYGFRAMTSDYA
ncbi:MAG: tetratricopeptide repeat protein [Roseiarcus sp.]